MFVHHRAGHSGPGGELDGIEIRRHSRETDAQQAVRLFRIALEVGQLRSDQLPEGFLLLSHRLPGNGLLEGEIDSAGRIRASRLENPRSEGRAPPQRSWGR